MKKIFILIIQVIITSNNSYAQFLLGVDAGYSVNHLSTDISNRTYTKNTNGSGYNVNLHGAFIISDRFKIQTGIGLIQKSYSFVRTGYYEGIYENFTNSYLQIPSLAQFRVLIIKKVKVHFNSGIYGAYWTSAYVDGTLPNIFDSTNQIDDVGEIAQFFAFTEYSEKYSFNQDKDSRIEYGFVTGLEFNYDPTSRYSVILKASYYQSIADQQKDYMVNQIAKRNQTFCISVGYLIKFQY
jgi:hypothetical protein